jgi:hypothetical protein
LLAQRLALTPTTTALGQRSTRVAAVCTSPFGSLKVISASSDAGRDAAGSDWTTKLATPFLSVTSGTLSATSLPSSRSPPSPSPASCSLGSRGGSKLNSS